MPEATADSSNGVPDDLSLANSLLIALRQQAATTGEEDTLFCPNVADVRRVALNLAFVALTRGDTGVARRLLVNVGLDSVACMEEVMLHTCRPALRQTLLGTLQDIGWQPSPEVVSAGCGVREELGLSLRDGVTCREQAWKVRHTTVCLKSVDTRSIWKGRNTSVRGKIDTRHTSSRFISNPP